MATAKKIVAKKVVKKAPTKSAQQFSMPTEVKEWIDQASSRLAYMTSEILRLKEENQKLKRNHKIMEQRVMGMSIE
jgi:cell division septum initiation protein DivIVA